MAKETKQNIHPLNFISDLNTISLLKVDEKMNST